MFASLDTSTSALVAHRQWLEVISSNIANQHAITDADGNYNPFRRKIAVFAPGDPSSGSRNGVHLQKIMDDDAPFVRKFQPGHVYADEDGYVNYPNVNPVIEQMNAMVASRAYEANVTAAQATKMMMQNSLRLLG